MAERRHRRPTAGTPALDVAGFDALMAAVGPFERRPHVAVAVSGGADSLCLAILAGRWAAARGGRVIALTVDHGLRVQAPGEARQVGDWLGPHGIEHHVLRWAGAKPATGIQAAARAARYGLMTGHCRAAGALHLLLGHTLDDQAETVLLRLGSGSGLDGLAAMAAIRETADVRLLRPFLGLGRDVPRATLDALGQPWIEDPSNRDVAYGRVRARRAIAAGGLDSSALALAAERFGRARVALESEVSKLLAGTVRLHPAGFAVVRRRPMADAPAELSLRALARVIAAVGGREYGPAADKLERVRARLARPDQQTTATLGRCRVIAAGGHVLVCREARNLPVPLAVRPGMALHWDGRFDIAFAGVDAEPETGAPELRRLGRDGWAEIVAIRPDLRQSPIPQPARATLPALIDGAGVVQVPNLGYRRPRPAGRAESRPITFTAAGFRPPQPISGVGFALPSGRGVLSL